MNELIASIYENPEKWYQTRHTLKHDNGIEVWTANGFWFLKPENGGSFNFIQRIRMHRAYRWWLANAPISHITGKIPV